MTRRTNAGIAGFTYLIYIAAGIMSMRLSMHPHATAVLTLVMSFSALTLGVTLYSITRDQDPDIALLAMLCRVVEAVPGQSGEMFFAVGSTLFCWLLLRGRMIPAALAWLGVVASLLLVVIIPLRLAGLFGGATDWSSRVTWLVWLPMLVFELVFAAWLIVKGVAAPARRQTA